jgi:hypothetical protein
MKVLIAYISLVIINIILFILLLRVIGYINFEYIDAKILIFLIIFPLSLVYHKYKPMSFGDVIFKYIGIKLPTWETISYKLKVFIGIDPDYLDKDKK